MPLDRSGHITRANLPLALTPKMTGGDYHIFNHTCTGSKLLAPWILLHRGFICSCSVSFVHFSQLILGEFNVAAT